MLQQSAHSSAPAATATHIMQVLRTQYKNLAHQFQGAWRGDGTLANLHRQRWWRLADPRLPPLASDTAGMASWRDPSFTHPSKGQYGKLPVILVRIGPFDLLKCVSRRAGSENSMSPDGTSPESAFLLFRKKCMGPNTEHETFPDVLTQQTFPFAYTNTSHTAQALWLVSVLPLAPIFHHEMGMSGGAVPKKSRLRRTEGDCRAVLKNFGACGGRFQGR